MKRLVILLFVLTPFMIACDKTDKTDPLYLAREAAWNSLDNTSQATVTVKWRNAKVLEETYQDKKAYAVRFNTKDDALLGPIIVYVDKTSFKVLGQGLRL